MRRTILFVALLALLAVAALAMTASAQTDPPTSGDWVVSDTTLWSNPATITGNVRVIGSGSLTLSNVNLRFAGAGTHEISVTNNAQLSIVGGRISSLGGLYTLSLAGRTTITNCDMTQLSGITITTWRANINNCTMVGTVTVPMATAISASPVDSYPGAPLQINDNRIENCTGNGININIGSFGTVEVKVLCLNNTILDTLQTGLAVTANTDKARILLRNNHVERCAGNGVRLSLTVRVVEMRLDGVYVKNVTDDGVLVSVTCSIHHMKRISDLSSIGNGGEGVDISFNQVHWDRPEFRRWYIAENLDGGIHFRNFNCATLEDSYNVNDGSPADYTMENTVLAVYKTTHRKANARVSGSLYHVTSYRYLHFRATWQNGIPCRYNTVIFEDLSGEVLFNWQSDLDGSLGNHTEWDWRVTSTQTHNRAQLSTFLIGGQQRLPGPGLVFDRDFREDLVFHDNQPPDLTVEKPSSNHVQNTADLDIEGKCIDVHSGAKLVQVSFDPEANWRKKFWYNTTGTSAWNRTFEWPDGVHTIYVRAFDFANYPGGIFANVTIINVTIDTSAPNLTIIQPIPIETITNSSQYTVLGTTDPDVVTLTLNGEFIASYGGTFNKALSLNEGKNSIVIVATDYAGNIAKAFRNITLDSIPPILVISYPPDGLRTNRQTLTMGGFTDLMDISMTVDGVPVQIDQNGAWSHTLTLLRGKNTINIDAVDIALNHRVVSLLVTYDPDPPVILVSSPSNGEVINTSRFRLLGTTDPDILHNQIQVNEIYIGISGGVFDYEMTVVEEGLLNISIVAEDLAGNVGTKVIQVFIDTTAPRIHNLSLIDGDIVNKFTLTITGETEEDARLFIQGDIVNIVAGRFTTQVHLNEGENFINFRVNDQASNVRTIVRRVTLDTVPPTIYLDNIVGNVTRTEDRFITLVGKAEVASKLTVHYSGFVEEVYIAANGEFSHPVILGKNKTTMVSLRAEDYAGNVNQWDFLVKRIEKEEESLWSRYSTVFISIIIIIVIVLVVPPLVKSSMEAEYKRRLKIMGVGTEAPKEGAPPAPGDRPRRPPRPPEAGEGTPRAPPRPPRPEEGAPRAPPRPPRAGE